MDKKIKRNNGGFTLIELLSAAAISMVIILTVGIVLADSHKGWSKMYDRAHGNVTTGGYVAKAAFDAVVRRSSISAKMPVIGSSREYLEVYYYTDSASAVPDRYAKFYVSGSSLFVNYGQLDSSGVKLDSTSTVELAKAVKSVQFSGIGTYIQMVLKLGDSTRDLVVTCATNRHSL